MLFTKSTFFFDTDYEKEDSWTFFGVNYQSFGAPMTGRTFSSEKYRYGFNGKENDNDVKNITGSQQDYGMRIYDPRLGKFLSVDPKWRNYPSTSPYSFAGNNPIAYIDHNGEEPIPRFKAYSVGERFTVGFSTTIDRKARKVGLGLYGFLPGGMVNGVIDAYSQGDKKTVARDIGIEAGTQGAMQPWKIGGGLGIQEAENIGSKLEILGNSVSVVVDSYDIINEANSNPTLDEVLIDYTKNIMTDYYGVRFEPGTSDNSHMSVPNASLGFTQNVFDFYSADEFSDKLNHAYTLLYTEFSKFQEEDGTISKVSYELMKQLFDNFKFQSEAFDAIELQEKNNSAPDINTKK
jgi:RHS repeat-associated protein